MLVDGARIPFAQSSTIYNDYMGVDLQKLAYKGLIDKTAVDPKQIDYIFGGNGKKERREGGREGGRAGAGQEGGVASMVRVHSWSSKLDVLITPRWSPSHVSVLSILSLQPYRFNLPLRPLPPSLPSSHPRGQDQQHRP